MAHDHYRTTNERQYMPLEGFEVKRAWHDYTDSMYPYVRIEFTNGQALTVEEIGQTGEIKFTVEKAP